jgi:methyl-accepting chemotaxis protein
MVEQERAIREMLDGARNVSKQVNMIARANSEQSTSSITILNGLSDIRQITERNAQGVKETLRSTDSLIERAQALNTIIDGLNNNGRAVKSKNRNKKKSKK